MVTATTLHAGITALITEASSGFGAAMDRAIAALARELERNEPREVA